MDQKKNDTHFGNGERRKINKLRGNKSNCTEDG